MHFRPEKNQAAFFAPISRSTPTFRIVEPYGLLNERARSASDFLLGANLPPFLTSFRLRRPAIRQYPLYFLPHVFCIPLPHSGLSYFNPCLLLLLPSPPPFQVFIPVKKERANERVNDRPLISSLSVVGARAFVRSKLGLRPRSSVAAVLTPWQKGSRELKYEFGAHVSPKTKKYPQFVLQSCECEETTAPVK